MEQLAVTEAATVPSFTNLNFILQLQLQEMNKYNLLYVTNA